MNRFPYHLLYDVDDDTVLWWCLGMTGGIQVSAPSAKSNEAPNKFFM